MLLLDDFQDIVVRDEPLARHTYFRLGGPAEFFVRPRNLDELAAIVRRCLENDIPMHTLGGGSNVLARDEGVRGVVLHLADEEFSNVRVEGTTVKAGAAALLSHVIAQSVRAGLAGLENLVGIPGTVGGALHMNAGGRAGDIGQFVIDATVMNAHGDIETRGRDDLSFAYRQSNLDEPVILAGGFELEQDDPGEIARRMRKLWILKKAGQPLSFQSAGCIFKNPRELSAGSLIDQAGLKGTRVGKAEISERHANFIVAQEGATSQDVLRLIDLARSRVAERCGIELELEIKIW
jgi:UDP-N-acetylmuramate dehydrogenase